MPTSFYVAKNNASGKLASAILSTGTLLPLQSGQGALFPTSFPFPLTIDNEIVKATGSTTADTFVILRAQESTTADAHNTDADVRLNITAKFISDLQTAVNALETLVHNTATYAIGDLFFANSATTTASLAIGSSGQGLFASSAGTPVWQASGGAAWRNDQAPTGTVNGTNTVFVVPDAIFIANSLTVSLNGQMLTHGSDFAETNPTGGTFTMVTAPAPDAVLRAHYLLNQSPFANADTVDGIHATQLQPSFGVVFSTSSLALANGTYADVPGATVTLVPTVPSKLVIIATFDMDTPGNGYSANGKVNIDGTNQTPTAILGATATSLTYNRGHAVTMATANLSAGSHTIKLQGQNSGTSAGYIRAPHTHFFYFMFAS